MDGNTAASGARPRAATGKRFVWHPQARLTAPPGAAAHGLAAALRAGAGLAAGPDGIKARPEAPGWLHTRSGGTTGPAKIVRRSHASWIASFEVSRAVLGCGPADVYAVLGTPEHSLALYAMVEAAHLGAHLRDLGGLSPRRQAAALAEAGATILYATPTQLRLLAEAGRPVPTLRHVLSGGGRMPEDLPARMAALAPAATLREFYGSSEASFIAWGDAARPAGSVGRPYPGVELRIDAVAGEPGEIWVRSPYLFDGYADPVPAAGGADWRDGWLSVGEIGRRDAEGFLHLSGRRNRMVTIAGQNVFPETIEAWLAAQEGVGPCAVLPRPDALRGTVLVALRAGAADPEGDARLLAAARARFDALAAPRRIVALPDFPLTAAGKPDLGRLAVRLAELT
ncbi:AMP-binding protein [Roseivivax sp. CAU 1761]